MKTNILYLTTVALVVLAAFSIASAAWTTPVPVSALNTPYSEGPSCVSSDNLTLYFTRGGTPDHYWNQLYQATRSSLSDSFSNPTIISELACDEHETNPWVLPGNTDMYFARTWQIKESTRATIGSPWGTPQNLISINSTGPVANPKVSTDELSIVFNVYPDEHTSFLYTASRNDSSSAFTNIRSVSELNGVAGTNATILSGDGLSVCFIRNEGGVWHNYESIRPTINGTFGTPQLLNYWPAGYGLSCFSADGQTAYLGYNGDIYVSQIPEPATMLLLGLGGMALRAKNAKRKA